MVTTADIDSAQQELSNVIETARANGQTVRTSAEWAFHLGRVATLRNQFALQQKVNKIEMASRLHVLGR